MKNGEMVAAGSNSFVDYINNLDKCQNFLNSLVKLDVIEPENCYISLTTFTDGWADYQP